VGVPVFPDGTAHLVAEAAAMTDEQELCLACGGPVGRAGRVCDDCLWDTREDDHEEPVAKEQRG
jgi:predicted amidophosphoribosyltransferase